MEKYVNVSDLSTTLLIIITNISLLIKSVVTVLTTLRKYLMSFNQSYFSYRNIPLLSSIPSSTASQVVVGKISQTYAGMKVADDREKYGNGIGPRLFDEK